MKIIDNINVHFKRMVLTKNKKTYSGIQLSKEGKIFNNEVLDIKGLQIRKVSTPRIARDFFSNILENEILKAPNPNPIAVFKDFMSFEEGLLDSIVHKQETKFLKPGMIKNISQYKNKYSLQTYRGVATWNAIFPNEAISENSAIKLLELKKMPVEDLRAYLDEKQFDALMDMYNDPEDKEQKMLNFGFTILAIPFNRTNYPEQFKDIVYVEKITNHIMKSGNILLESLKFKTVTTSGSFQSPSNIIDI